MWFFYSDEADINEGNAEGWLTNITMVSQHGVKLLPKIFFKCLDNWLTGRKESVILPPSPFYFLLAVFTTPVL